MATYRVPVNLGQPSVADERVRVSLSDGRTVLYPAGTPSEMVAEDLFRRFPEERQHLSRTGFGDFFRALQAGVVGGTVGAAGAAQALITGDPRNVLRDYSERLQEQLTQRNSLLTRIESEESAARIEESRKRGEWGLTQMASELVGSPGFAITAAGNITGSIGSAALMGGAVGAAARLGVRAAGASPATALQAGVGTAIGTGAVQHGAMAGGDALDRYLAMPLEQYQQMPEFPQYLQQYGTPQEAKNRLALELARKVAGGAAAVSAAGTVLLGAPVERAVMGARRVGLPATVGMPRAVGSGALRESVQEGAFEEGAAVALANLAAQQIDPAEQIQAGVGGAALLGALGGAPFGGMAGAVQQGRVQRAERQAADAQAKEAQRQQEAQARSAALLDPTRAMQATLPVPFPDVKPEPIPKEVTSAAKKYEAAMASHQEAQRAFDQAAARFDPDDIRMERYQRRLEKTTQKLGELGPEYQQAFNIVQQRKAAKPPRIEGLESEAERAAFMRGEPALTPMATPQELEQAGQETLFDYRGPTPIPDAGGQMALVPPVPQPAAAAPQPMEVNDRLDALVAQFNQQVQDGDITTAEQTAREYESMAREANVGQLPLPTSRVTDPADYVETQRRLFPTQDAARTAVVPQDLSARLGWRYPTPLTPDEQISAAHSEGLAAARAQPPGLTIEPVRARPRDVVPAMPATMATPAAPVAAPSLPGVPPQPTRRQMVEEIQQRVRELNARDAQPPVQTEVPDAPPRTTPGEGMAPQRVGRVRAGRDIGADPRTLVDRPAELQSEQAAQRAREDRPEREQPKTDQSRRRSAGQVNRKTKSVVDTLTKQQQTEATADAAHKYTSKLFDDAGLPKFLVEHMRKLKSETLRAMLTSNPQNIVDVHARVYDEIVESLSDADVETTPITEIESAIGVAEAANPKSDAVTERVTAALKNLQDVWRSNGRVGPATPLPETAAGALAGNDVMGVLQSIVDDPSPSRVAKLVARLLMGVPGLSNVTIEAVTIPADPDGTLPAAQYNPETLLIQLDLNRGLTIEDTLHEVIHAVTAYALWDPTQEQQVALRELNRIYNLAKEKLPAGHYGLTSLHEFIAEAMSNPEFQALLMSIETPGPKRNVWQRFMDAVKELLGLFGTDNLMAEAATYIEAILGEPRSVKAADFLRSPRRERNVVDALRPRRNPVTSAAKGYFRAVKGADFSVFDKFHDYIAPIERLYKDDAQLSGNGKVRPDLGLRMAQLARGIASKYLRIGNLQYDENGVAYVNTERPVVESMDGVQQVMKDEAKRQNRNVREIEDIFHAAVLAKRAQALEPIGMNVLPLTNEQIAQGVALYDDPANGWIREAYRRFRVQNDNIVRLMVESGAIAPDMGEKMIEAAAYVPFRRVIEQTGAQDTDYILTGSFLNPKELKKLKGGFAEIENVLDNMAANTALMVELAIKRNAVRNTIRSMANMGLAHRAQKNDPTAIKFYEGGEEVFWRTNDPDLYQALIGVPEITNPLLQASGFATKFVRTGVTLNPVFMLKELVRGPLQLWMTGQVPDLLPFRVLGKTLSNFVSAAVGRNRDVDKMFEYGVTGGYEAYNRDIASIPQAMRTRTGFGAVMRVLQRASELADASVRATLYQERIKAGDTPAIAAYRALELINFHRKGRSKVVNSMSYLVPFHSAAVQGLSMELRTLTGHNYAIPVEERNLAARRMRLRIGMLAISGLAYAAAWDGDDEYDKAPEGERDMNWFVPIGDDTLKVPVAYGFGMIAKSLAERTYNAMQGKSDAFRDFGKALEMTFVPGADIVHGGALLKPIIEVMANYDFFREAPITPPWKTALDTADQYTDRTTQVARMVSATTGSFLSPTEVDHLVRGYTASLGVSFSALLDATMRTVGVVPERPVGLSRGIKDLPLVGDLFRNPESDTQLVKYYEAVQSARAYQTEINRAIKEGRRDDALRMQEQQATKVQFQQISKELQKAIRQLNERERAIRYNPNVDIETLRRLKESRAQLARQALAIQEYLDD